MKVLFVAAHPPLPLDNGGRLRTFHLLEELAARAEVRLVCFDREPGSRDPYVTAAEIAAALGGLDRVGVVRAPGGKRTAQLMSLLTGSSYTMRIHASGDLQAAVRAAELEWEPDLIHIDSLFCAGVRPRAATAGTWVLSLHNDEALLKERLAGAAPGWPRRTLYRSEARALAELQREEIASFDHCVAVSDAERERFAAHNPSTVTIPNGVEPLGPPQPRDPLPGGEPLRLLFVGSLNYEPNRAGLEWFAREVAPLARERLAIDVEVVGPGRRGPELAGVRYLGRVDNLDAAYARADAAVVPLRVGAGSRLKVLEALARGVPLVSTPLGVEGFDLHDGEQALIAAEPASLVERLVLLDASLRGDGHLAEALRDAGHRFAADYFWPQIGELLGATYGAWAEEAPSSSASTSAHSP